MEEKWNENFAQVERILIRAAVLLLLVASLVKIVGPEIHEAYTKLIGTQETYQGARQQPGVRLTDVAK